MDDFQPDAAEVRGCNSTASPRSFRERYSAASPGAFIITLNDPFLQTGGTAAVRAINVNYVPPDQKDGDVWKWSFDIQRELLFGTALTVGYVGSSSHVGNSIGNSFA